MVTNRKRMRLSAQDEPSLQERAAACEGLRANVLRQDFVPSGGGAARANVDGRKVYLPAYVPYIGPAYFGQRPRVLCYAINQNLSRHTRWTQAWTARWARDFDLAVDRLNRAAEAGAALPIKPYAEGFMPLIAAMAFDRFAPRANTKVPAFIDDIISVTNFVKFSTSTDASSSSIPESWWRECRERYVKLEVEALRPDIIISFGRRTTLEIQRVLAQLSCSKPKPTLLHSRFPSRIPSVKARPLSAVEAREWTHRLRPLAAAIKQPPASSYHKWRIAQYPGYFIDVLRSWRDTQPGQRCW